VLDHILNSPFEKRIRRFLVVEAELNKNETSRIMYFTNIHEAFALEDASISAGLFAPAILNRNLDCFRTYLQDQQPLTSQASPSPGS